MKIEEMNLNQGGQEKLEKIELSPNMQELYNEIVDDNVDENALEKKAKRMNENDRSMVLNKTIQKVGGLTRRVALLAFLSFSTSLAGESKAKDIEKELFDEVKSEWTGYEKETLEREKNFGKETKETLEREKNFEKETLEREKNFEKELKKNKENKDFSQEKSFLEEKIKDAFKKDGVKIKEMSINYAGDGLFEILIDGSNYNGAVDSSKDLQTAIDKATFTVRSITGAVSMKHTFYEKGGNLYKVAVLAEK